MIIVQNVDLVLTTELPPDTDPTRFCGQIYNALRVGGTAIVFYDLWKLTHLSEAMVAAGFKQLRLIIWEKTTDAIDSSGDLMTNYRENVCEIAVLGVKGGKPIFHSKYDSGLYRYPDDQRLQLITDLVLKHSNPDDLVIDPFFLGTGPTAMACANRGRRFAGGDLMYK